MTDRTAKSYAVAVVATAILAACVLAACATPAWYKEGATKSEEGKAELACGAESDQASSSGSDSDQEDSAEKADAIFAICMEARGWTQRGSPQ